MRDFKSNKIIITGGSGFIGSNVAEGFAQDGYKVVIVDRVRPTNKKCEWIKCDLGEREAVKVLKKCFDNKDFVFHFAAMADVREVYKSPLQSIYDNHVSLANVIHACIIRHVSRIIFASSYWVSEAAKTGYEKSDLSFKGSNNIYGNEKIAGEFLIHSWSKLHAFKYSILRLGNPYGPRMWSGLVLRELLARVLKGKSIEFFGNGKQTRQFIYVGDVYRVCKAIVEKHRKIGSEIYNVTGDKAITIAQLVTQIEDLLGIQVKRKRIKSSKSEPLLKYCPNNRTKSALGVAFTDLNQGLAATIEWYKKNA